MARAVFDICSSSPKPLHHRGFADDQGFDLKASYSNNPPREGGILPYTRLLYKNVR